MNHIRFRELLRKQRELDDFIISKHPEPLSLQYLLQTRVLALAVELGECANEVKSFKHWSRKEPSARDIILEEYVDCLHFALSITNTVDDEIDVHDIKLFAEVPGEINPDKALVNGFFIATIQAVTSLPIAVDESVLPIMIEKVKDIWVLFGMVGIVLGFSEKDVLDMYEHKYQININRQKEGY